MDPLPPSDRDRIRKIDDIFADAIELPPEQRLPFVTERCRSNPSLSASVLRLLDRFDRLGSFLDAPAGGSPFELSQLLPPGTILNNRFAIQDCLGEGGMGVIYSAEDRELGEVVALKMVREQWLDNPSVLARFRDEIRLARKISHRNVCRIYEFFPTVIDGRERAFFTMECLRGQSLATQMSTGERLAAESILHLAQGIACGLDEAHRCNILHRDLKPGNVFLDSSEEAGARVVIMDFGLAKAFENLAAEDGSQTQPAQIVGSPDYMAPEQFMGEGISAATDIYSFALILYELAAGRRPYPDQSIFRLAIRRATEAPPPLGAESCAPHWWPVLKQALSPDPSRRPASARELVRELGRSVSPSPKISRRTAMISAGATISLSIFGGIYRFRGRDAKNPAEPVLMLNALEPFNGYENAPALDLLLRTQIQKSAHVAILGAPDMRKVWNRIEGRNPAPGAEPPLPARFEPALARQIALRAGANCVLFGSVSRTGSEYELKIVVEVLDPSPNARPKPYSHRFPAGSETALLNAAVEAGSWVRSTVGETAASIGPNRPPSEDLTTNDWLALQKYVEASQLWSLGPQGPGAEQAIRKLREALDRDPGFALAAARLGDYLVAVYREDEGLHYEQVAANLVTQRDLTDRESFRIRAIYDQDSIQDDRAIAILSDWSLAYPKDVLPVFLRAFSLARKGRSEEGLALLERAARVDPAFYPVAQALSVAYLRAGRIGDAQSALNRAAALQPNDWTLQAQSGLAFANFDLGSVRKALDRMRTAGSAPFQCRAVLLQGCLLTELGQYLEAEAALRSAIQLAIANELPASIFECRLRLTDFLILRNRHPEAIRLCRTILEGQPGARWKMQTGCLLARAGDFSGARETYCPRPDPNNPEIGYQATPSFEIWRSRLNAEIALAANDPRQAVRLLDAVQAVELIDEWPEYRVRALIAAKEFTRAASLLERLFRNPGIYWYLANASATGFIRQSLEAAQRFKLYAGDFSGARLVQMLFHSNR